MPRLCCFPFSLPLGCRWSCGPGVFLPYSCLPVTLPRPTTFTLESLSDVTGVLSSAYLNTFLFFCFLICVMRYTSCHLHRHESPLFCLLYISTAPLECSGLFSYLLSIYPSPTTTHTYNFFKQRYFKAYPTWIISLTILQFISLTEKAFKKKNTTTVTLLHLTNKQ